MRGDEESATASAASVAAAATSAADTVAQQASFHFAQRFELLRRRVSFQLLVAHGALPLGHLRLKYRGKMSNRRRGGRASGYILEKLHCALVVLR